MLKGAIFDMDGLMFDTERLALNGWMQAGKILGYPITEELVNQIRGTKRKCERDRFQPIKSNPLSSKMVA